MRCNVFTSKFVGLVYLCIYASVAFAQVNRDFEPVVLKGDAFSGLSEVAIADLFLYAYDANQGWRQIPFQFDEIGVHADTSFSYFFKDDGLFDADDELVFLYGDAGADAGANWLDDLSSQNYARHAIAVSDPIGIEPTKWAYLYRSETLSIDMNVPGYMAHTRSETAVGGDVVTSTFYSIRHDDVSALPVDLTISPEAGGSGVDLLDALKFRAVVSLGVARIPLKETFIQLVSEGDEVKAIVGKVRIIRQLDGSFNLFNLFSDFDTPPLFYYPKSVIFDLDVPDVSALASAAIISGRLSVDLNANAVGMNFTSANNSMSFPIDGTPESSDTVNTVVDNVLPDGNWVSITGAQGTVVHLFPIATTVGGARSLYYKDDATEDSLDTGDLMSYGDAGINITQGIELPFRLSYQGYFLGSDAGANAGAKVAAIAANPAAASVTGQQYDPASSVESVGNVIPDKFALSQNHPNPFNPSTEISYSVPRHREGAQRVSLTIYNLLGQPIRTLVDEMHAPGIYTAAWDGRDDFGREVTSGIYIYQLTSGDYRQSMKMALVK